MTDYDRWLFNGDENCKPVIEKRFLDEDGFPSGQWSCEGCINEECENWKNYN